MVSFVNWDVVLKILITLKVSKYVPYFDKLLTPHFDLAYMTVTQYKAFLSNTFSSLGCPLETIRLPSFCLLGVVSWESAISEVCQHIALVT